MKQISIYKEGNTWVTANLDNGCPDPEIVALFGTHILPTPFFGAAEPWLVYQRISDRNPDAQVSLRSGGF